MIENEGDNSFINRLQVMHMCKVDLSLLLGVKYREAILHAQKERIMHPEQYGGLQWHDVAQITMIEEAEIDDSFLTRLAFTNLDTDSTA